VAVDQIARLGLEVTSDSIVKATKRLDRLEEQSKNNVKQNKNLRKSFDDSKVAILASVVAVGALTAKIIKQVNKYQDLTNKLKLVTKGSKDLEATQKILFKISQTTRASLESTVELYSRFARSTEKLGLSQAELARITETVNKTLVISGSSTQAADAAIVQLGQGLASGTLRGQELNSVLEQAPRLAKALADGMGIARGELRAMGAAGKITAEQVVNALKSQSRAVDEEFGKMDKTISQAMVQIDNQFLQTFGSIKGGGLVQSLDEFREVVSDPSVVSGLQSIATALIFITTSLVSAVGGFAKFGNAIGVFIAGGELGTELERINEKIALTQSKISNAENVANMVGKTSAKRTSNAVALLKELNAEQELNLSIKRMILQESTVGGDGGQEDADKKLADKVAAKENEQSILSEMQRSNAQKEIDALSESLRSKEEKQLESIENQMFMVEEHFSNLFIKEEERTALLAQLEAERVKVKMVSDINDIKSETKKKKSLEKIEQGHQKNLSKIESDASKARLKFEKMTTAMKVKTVIGSAVQITQGVAQQNKALFQINKYAAIADVAVNLPSAVIKSFNNAGGYPYGLIPAGLMLATGVQQLMSIKSTTFGSGGAAPSLSGGGGGGAGAPINVVPAIPAQDQPIPTNNIPSEIDKEPTTIFNIEISGNPTGDQVRELMEMIEEETDDNTQFNLTQSQGG